MKSTLIGTAALAVCLTGPAIGATFGVDLDAKVNIGAPADGKRKAYSLLPGEYSIEFVSGKFEAWRFGNNPLTCDSSGENCGDGWQSNFEVNLFDGTILTGYGSPTTYISAANSLAVAQAAGPVKFFLSSVATVYFGLPDKADSGADNSGGVSLLVTGPGLSQVPLPASVLGLILGIAGLAAAGRRKSRPAI